jgi:multidrug resistance efflux pump
MHSKSLYWRFSSFAWFLLVIGGFAGMVWFWSHRYAFQVETCSAFFIAEEVSVCAGDLAQVNEIAVHLGDRINSGDRLGTLHSDVAQHRIQEAQRKLAGLQRELAVAEVSFASANETKVLEHEYLAVECTATDSLLKASMSIMSNQEKILAKAQALAKENIISIASLLEYEISYWKAKMAYHEAIRNAEAAQTARLGLTTSSVASASGRWGLFRNEDLQVLEVKIAHLREEVALANAAVNFAKERATFLSDLKAPVEGVVERIEVSVGQLVQPSDVVAVIRQPARRVDGLVRESDCSDLRLGQRVTIELNNDDTRLLTGELTHIGSVHHNGRAVQKSEVQPIVSWLFRKPELYLRVVVMLIDKGVDVPNGISAHMIFKRHGK